MIRTLCRSSLLGLFSLFAATLLVVGIFVLDHLGTWVIPIENHDFDKFLHRELLSIF